jgi:DNA-binding CsgD family transcriptional regulator
MPGSRTLDQTLKELRRIARGLQRRPARMPEAAPLIARLLGSCRTLAIEKRANGIHTPAGGDEAAGDCLLTCVIHEAADSLPLTQSERAVAEQLCEGRTLAQIAGLRGVTVNTIKTQVRQIFRKLDVDTRRAGAATMSLRLGQLAEEHIDHEHTARARAHGHAQWE